MHLIPTHQSDDRPAILDDTHSAGGERRPLLDLDRYWLAVNWTTELAQYGIRMEPPREKS